MKNSSHDDKQIETSIGENFFEEIRRAAEEEDLSESLRKSLRILTVE